MKRKDKKLIWVFFLLLIVFTAGYIIGGKNASFENEKIYYDMGRERGWMLCRWNITYYEAYIKYNYEVLP